MKASKAVSFVFLIILSLCAVNTRPAKAQSSGTIYIRSDGSVEGTDKIQRAGDVYTFTANIYDPIVVERNKIVIDGLGYTVQGDGSGIGMNLTRRGNVTITNMKVKDFRYGIFCDYFSEFNTVVGNNITNNVDGVHLSYALNNTISGNTITNNVDGIASDVPSDYNTIVGNNITDNHSGIRLTYSDFNCISGNNITDNWYGIQISGVSKSNIISGNNIRANGYCGIFLDDFSSLNTIVKNKIANNYDGIYLGESTNNHIYHNNFMSNTQQVYTCNLTNVWDDGYPSGGNYWSDYEDKYPDAEEIDGIWDTPYVIDENNVDNHPMVPEFPSWTPMLLILIVLTVALAIAKRRLHRIPFNARA